MKIIVHTWRGLVDKVTDAETGKELDYEEEDTSEEKKWNIK